MSEKPGNGILQYAVFGDEFKDEACGGWCDYLGGYDTLAEAEGFVKEYLRENNGFGWCHVVDLLTQEIVAEF